jgi:hypothetical protein
VHRYKRTVFDDPGVLLARSLHTQKYNLRSARRLARPFSRRAEEALRLHSRHRRNDGDVSPRTTIRIRRLQSGCVHPLSRAEIDHFLTLVGPENRYGLTEIVLRQECPWSVRRMLFGEYRPPGLILLYAVPAPPWQLDFLPEPQALAALARHCPGLVVERALQRLVVPWTMDALKRFLLLEVLAHELGHHLLHKRRGRHGRVTDHEARAELHRRRLAALLAQQPPCS